MPLSSPTTAGQAAASPADMHAAGLVGMQSRAACSQMDCDRMPAPAAGRPCSHCSPTLRSARERHQLEAAANQHAGPRTNADAARVAELSQV
eukprot:365122-Chlamydomonas_euryale.AAC.3